MCAQLFRSFWKQRSASNFPLIFLSFLLEAVSLAQAVFKQTCLRWPNPSSLRIPGTEVLWAFVTRAYYQPSSILTSPSTHFFKRFIFIFCVCVYRHVPALHVCMCSTRMAGTLWGSPSNVVPDNFKPLCGCWQSNPGFLEEQAVLLNTEARTLLRLLLWTLLRLLPWFFESGDYRHVTPHWLILFNFTTFSVCFPLSWDRVSCSLG